MNDQEFDKVTLSLRHSWSRQGTRELREYVLGLQAKRNALARVEAELKATYQKLLAKTGAHEFLKYGVNNVVKERDTAQAQLAEAVRFIKQVSQWPNGGSTYGQEQIKTSATAFLARHAKAEQQEAQAAQAGGERAAFEGWYRRTLSPGATFNKNPDGSYESGNCQGRWLTWQARAALAIQPAAGEPADGVEGFACWLIDHCEGYEIFEEKIQEWVAGYLKSEAYQRVAAPPAAAHGEDGRTCRFCQKRFGSAGECGNHVDQFHHDEAEPAAQGDM